MLYINRRAVTPTTIKNNKTVIAVQNQNGVRKRSLPARRDPSDPSLDMSGLKATLHRGIYRAPTYKSI
jgi:hypothetical protein